MSSTIENPIKFLEDYLEVQVHRDLKAFYKGEEILSHSSTDIIDTKNQIIKVLDIQNPSNYISFTFENFINNKIIKELEYSKNLINDRVQKLSSNKIELASYIEVLYS